MTAAGNHMDAVFRQKLPQFSGACAVFVGNGSRRGTIDAKGTNSHEITGLGQGNSIFTASSRRARRHAQGVVATGGRAYYLWSSSIKKQTLTEKGARGGAIDFGGNTKVRNVEKAFMDAMGIRVQVEDKKGDLADDNSTLASLR
jgi:hypothetical protein